MDELVLEKLPDLGLDGRPTVIPASTTPITAVQVYKEEPRYRATSRAATSSITMMQKRERNTVAQGTKRGNGLPLFAFIMGFYTQAAVVDDTRVPATRRVLVARRSLSPLG